MTTGNGSNFKGLKLHFALFAQCILVIPMKLGRDLARGKRHFAREFDFKRPWPWKMVAILRLWINSGQFWVSNHIFALFSKYFLGISTKLGRVIARGTGHLVCEVDPQWPWPWDVAAILRVWNDIFALFSQCILVIPMKLGRDIARVRGTLSVNLTPNDFDLGKRWPILGSEMTFLHFSQNFF